VARYVTLSEFKDYCRNELPTADDAFLTTALDTAETMLDNACGRRFEIATASSPRLYIPDGTSLLSIDDCTSVTSVTENGAVIPAITYQLEPLNNLSPAGSVVPYDTIRRMADLPWYTDYGRATVSVVASWGWAAIPVPIKQSCLILGKDIAANRDVRFGLVTVSEAGGVGTRENAIVRRAVEDYSSSRATLVDFIGIA
jgi:hypothetical protein